MKSSRRAPKPFTVEVRSAGRQSRVKTIDKQPDWPELHKEPVEAVEQPPLPIEAARVAVLPTGRVLPALDVPAPVPAATKTRTPRQPRVTRPANATLIAEEMAAWVAHPGSTAAAAGAAAPVPVHHGVSHRLLRLPRSTYPLGERWKARLPALRHDVGGKGRVKPQ